jgi:molybdate transport system permease protein
MILTRFARPALFFLLFLMAGIVFYAAVNIRGEELGNVLKDKGFQRAIVFSLQTSLSATMLAFVVGLPAGFYLARNKGITARLLDALLDIPVVIPPLIVGVILLSVFNLPLLKKVYDFVFTAPGAVVAQFFVAVPFTVKSAKAGFDLVPPVYERIAMTLGAGPFKSFYDTTFKMAFPAILGGLTLTWLRCMGEFGATLMVGGGIPGKTENIPVYIYISMSSGDFEKGMAASILAIVFSFASILVVKLLGQSKRQDRFSL